MRDEIKIVAQKEVENRCILDIQKYLEEYIKEHNERRSSKGIKEIKVEIRTTHKEGEKIKHEFKTKFITDLDVFHSKKTGWNCYGEFKNSINSIDHQIKKIVGIKKRKDLRKKKETPEEEIIY